FPINLHGIGIDDGPAQSFSQQQSGGRLAARGGACNKHGVISHRASMFVLNVIGKGASPAQLERLGLSNAAILSPGMAFDLPVPEKDAPAILAEARIVAEGLKLDINLVAAHNRRKKLLVADMDSTIINVECLDELADMAGLKPKIAAITERAMRGELEFEAALRERAGMLKGLHLSALERPHPHAGQPNPRANRL